MKKKTVNLSFESLDYDWKKGRKLNVIKVQWGSKKKSSALYTASEFLKMFLAELRVIVVYVCVNGVEINNTVVAVWTINSSSATATVAMTTACGISRLGSSINPAAAVHKGFFFVLLGRRTSTNDDVSFTSLNYATGYVLLYPELLQLSIVVWNFKITFF